MIGSSDPRCIDLMGFHNLTRQRGIGFTVVFDCSPSLKRFDVVHFQARTVDKSNAGGVTAC
jgi:hypothetical protein